MRLFVLPLLTLALALPVFAVDGVLEINQTCAVNTGCFPGDTAAFPVKITASGSYRLTSNLSPAAADAIGVSAEDVTIDLNGFRLMGAGCCTGISADATPHVAVRNGVVRGFQFGLDMGAHNRVENLTVRNCGKTGIIMKGPGGFVRGNIVTDNLADGLQMGSDVAYGENQLSGNSPSNVVGGRAFAVNLCDGALCGVPRRRFYLTPTGHNGDQADEPGVCAPGFHFASMWEIHDPSNLAYDTSLGHVLADSGSGPSNFSGWIRTGGDAVLAPIPGFANCSAWASTDDVRSGTTVRLNGEWTPASAISSPWVADNAPCNIFPRVWCVED